MENQFSVETKGNWPDHYTDPKNHIIRVQTALSNTAARLWDVVEKSLDPSGRPRDAVAQRVVAAVTQIQDVETEAVASWQQGHFQRLTVDERLKTGAKWATAAKRAITEAAKGIESLPGDSRSLRPQVLGVLVAQETRLDSLLEEQRERAKLMFRPVQTQPGPKPERTAEPAVQAQTQSGIYRGPILEATDSVLVQRISSAMIVMHKKELLSRNVELGESVSIRYSGGTGSVSQLNERGRGLTSLER